MNCIWPLGNGRFLAFNVYPPDAPWQSAKGVYIFVRTIDDSHCQALYIGHTDDFSQILNHEKWSAALRLGATHIHALMVPLKIIRRRFARMLVQTLQTVLNQQ
jgi:hypothetical protein